MSDLDDAYPSACCELNYHNPLQLLVATVLSAQSTDVRVNLVTPALFARCQNAQDYAKCDRAELEELIHSVGFFRQKAESLIKIGAELVAKFSGEVPANLTDLVGLPGVGRKTANVVLGHAFGIPGITADTHVMRVSRRLGFTTNTKADKVEQDLNELFDPAKYTKYSDVLIFHGRRICQARKPLCDDCPVGALCPSFGKI